MRSKLISVGILAALVVLALVGGWTIRQIISRPVGSDLTRSVPSAQTPDPATAQEKNATTRAVNGLSEAKGVIETGALHLVDKTWTVTTPGKTKQLTIDSQTAVYLQGETLYQTNQGDAALHACAAEHCPVYAVLSPQSDVMSAVVLALAPAQQIRFPDHDPAGKTPIPWPSPTPPWIRLPSVVPATPLVVGMTPTPTRK